MALPRMRRRTRFSRGASIFMMVVVGGVWAGLPAPLPGDAPAVSSGKVVFQNLCLSCHGEKGAGNEVLLAPAIAGLPDWYVTAQLENFQKDRRGLHAADSAGQMMRTIAKVLTPAQAQEVATYVASLPRVKPMLPVAEPVLSKAGRELFEERCMECHRYNAEGELFFRSPPLVGHHGWYLRAQLLKFKAGHRGAVPGDEYGAKMVHAVGFIDSDELLESLIAFLLEMQAPKEQAVPSEATSGVPLQFGTD